MAVHAPPLPRGVATSTVLACAAVLGSYLAVRSGAASRLDAPAHRVLTGHHGPVADRVLGSATDLGSVYALAGVATALVGRGHRVPAGEVLLAGGGAWVAAQAAKPLLDRPRPYELASAARVVAAPAGSSWPSGHAALAAAMATSLGVRATPRTRWALAAGSAAIGLSRCYVGVHHLTDVVAGAGLGLLASQAIRWSTGRLSSFRARDERRP